MKWRKSDGLSHRLYAHPRSPPQSAGPASCPMSSMHRLGRRANVPRAFVRRLIGRDGLACIVTPHGKTVVYPFSMISPPKTAEKGAPRLSAMGGRAGFDPSCPLGSRSENRRPVRGVKNSPNFCPPHTCVALLGHFPRYLPDMETGKS